MTGVDTAQEQELGRAIATARKKAGLTQQELCVKANLSYSTLAKIERGAIKTPSVFTVAAIAASTQTTVEALTGVYTAPEPQVPQKAYKTAKNGVTFVYFDVNGVLVRFFQRAFTALANDVGIPVDTIEALFWRHNDAVNTGEMTVEEFDDILAKHIGVETISWRDYYMANVDPITEMHECVMWAAEHYRVGLMSNTMPGFLELMMQKGLLPNIHYDAIVDSSQEKVIKPDAALYEAAVRKAGVEPQQILLVDDDRMNLMAAEKLGWHVLWFDDYRPDEGANRVRQALTFE